MVRVPALCVVSFLLASVSAAFQWNTATDVYWAHGCDFYASDLTEVQTAASRCGPLCFVTSACTHFAWTNFNGGTCYLKSSPGISRVDAISNSKSGAVCGIARKASSPPGPKECVRKRVKIYKFCIKGNNDGGAHGEHQIRLDGSRYYPLSSGDCPQSPSGYCDWREGQCHNLQNARWRSIHEAVSLTVGTEEHDTTSENDSYSAYLSAQEWHSATCEPYEVRIAKPFEAEKRKEVCWELSGTVSGGVGGLTGEVSGGVTSCTEWVQPEESFIWFLTVQPE